MTKNVLDVTVKIAGGDKRACQIRTPPHRYFLSALFIRLSSLSTLARFVRSSKSVAGLVFSSSSKAFASLSAGVSKPSVNQL